MLVLVLPVEPVLEVALVDAAELVLPVELVVEAGLVLAAELLDPVELVLSVETDVVDKVVDELEVDSLVVDIDVVGDVSSLSPMLAARLWVKSPTQNIRTTPFMVFLLFGFLHQTAVQHQGIDIYAFK